MEKRELDRMLKNFSKNAKIIPNRPQYLRKGESSLHDIIKTKEQAEHFMRMIELARQS